MLFRSPEQNSLGVTTAYDPEKAQENKDLAVQTLRSLVPIRLRVFCPVVDDTGLLKAEVVDGLEQSSVDHQSEGFFNLLQQVFELNVASGENFRHLDHLSTDSNASKVMGRILAGYNQDSFNDLLVPAATVKVDR